MPLKDIFAEKAFDLFGAIFGNASKSRMQKRQMAFDREQQRRAQNFELMVANKQRPDWMRTDAWNDSMQDYALDMLGTAQWPGRRDPEEYTHTDTDLLRDSIARGEY